MLPYRDDLWAKSGNPGESLVAHTLNVVRRVLALRQRTPQLAAIAGDPRLFHRLALAAAIHDLGKADPAFQAMLRAPRGSVAYTQRHEVLSLAWLEWLLADDPHGDLPFVAAAVASHHKDHAEIHRLYDSGNRWQPSQEIEKFVAGLEAAIFGRVADLFLSDILPAVESLGLLAEDWQRPQPWISGPNDWVRTVRSIRRGLRAWDDLLDATTNSATGSPERRQGFLVRGLILLADHAGSAGVEFGSAPLLKQPPNMAQRLRPPAGHPYYPHQEQSADTLGHALLVAPTGSGKTEAALLWAARQYAEMPGQPPLFYVLPFKASMNAMRTRLVGNLAADPAKPTTQDDSLVALQHSSALQVLYYQLMDREYSEEDAKRTARQQQNLARLHASPVRVLSPYQILRAAYQLKGHEAIWTDAASGLFVFDEIHAYEPARLAQILELLRLLVEQFRARLFVMTATMPRPVRDCVEQLLGKHASITAAEATFAAFRRHRVRLRNADLLSAETAEEIADRTRRGQAVLAVATTVGRAQQLCSRLRRLLQSEGIEVRLLHSRFTVEDRRKKEDELQRLVGTRLGGKRSSKIVLVATQVVEVSLDVDFDALFSDPAPLECLLQRFGRVNRSLRPEPCDVIVCTVGDDSPVYYRALVLAAIEQLKGLDGSVIDESGMQARLDAIYEGAIGRWLADELENQRRSFRNTINSCMPFDTSAELEEKFYKLFDGTEVLPEEKLAEYRSRLDEHPLQASALAVPISHGQFYMLRCRGQISFPTEENLKGAPPVAAVPYSFDQGLELNPSPEDDST